MLFAATLTGDLLALLITLSLIVIGYYKWMYQYWKRRNLNYLEPHFPFGNFGGGRLHTGFKLKKLYDEMKARGWKHGGIYGIASPIYLVVDLDYVKNIMARDFQYFTHRGVYHNERADPLSAHLFNIDGIKWRNLRTKFTPTFTSGKMKMMFQTLIDCVASMEKKVQADCEEKVAIDIKEVLGCFTTDVIGSCAFGLECKTFEEENSAFRYFGKKAFQHTLDERLKRSFVSVFPNLSKKLNIVLHSRDLINFFIKLVKDTVDYRETNKVVRNDFLQLLIDLKNNKLAEEEGYKHDGTTLTIEEMVAQSYVFFIAGFETSSTTMTFALYELARNQEIQDKVRSEINSVLSKYDGKITFDAIHEMKYLNQVIDESLRMYSPALLLPRKCVKDYNVPGTDVVIEKGTTVLLPIIAIHYDEEYYPNSQKFDPDRFSEENKKLRHSYAHLPFGEGPRICIGMRFGLMQSKVGLASLLRKFKFTVNSKTQEPLQFKENSFVTAAKGEIWLTAHNI